MERMPSAGERAGSGSGTRDTPETSPAPEPPVSTTAPSLAGRSREEDALRGANERLNLLIAITRHDTLNDIAALAMYLDHLGPSRAYHPEVRGKVKALLGRLRNRMEFTRDYADLGVKPACWRDLARVVAKGIASVDPARLRVELDLPDIEIYADPLFERVIGNLVDNTLRHGEGAASIRFRALTEGEGCTLIVEDDGPGIPSGTKASIFRPGYGRHTGLGLFLVREILGITGMGIRETGEHGRGARFEILIPPGGFRRKNYFREEKGFAIV